MVLALVIPDQRDRPVRLDSIPLNAPNGQGLPTAGSDLQADCPHLDAVLVWRRPDPDALLNPLQQNAPVLENKRATTFAWLHDRRVRLRQRVYGDAYLVAPYTGSEGYRDVPEIAVEHLMGSWAYQVQITSPASPHAWAPYATGYTRWERAYEHALQLSALQGAATDARVVHLAPDRQVQLWAQIAREHLRRHHGSTLVAGPLADGSAHEFDQQDLNVCWSVPQLAEGIGAEPLRAGTAFRYGDLCLVNLADGQERWLLIHGTTAFEVTPLRPCIAAGVFDSLISAITALPAQPMLARAQSVVAVSSPSLNCWSSLRESGVWCPTATFICGANLLQAVPWGAGALIWVVDALGEAD
ncbi:hypothetical protein Kisp01_70560 [Kineosporia sp. NBRC 101677]|uniref:hypothetical protein n=1 Tax=Kineosporia sp. NBRC 101677 TaxID=3032197 RepID=UPI0024A12BC9|nr:hypothetical protein [Kineosporia sp. NBRC 101677]GLY20042.1 hypothetical protein Kisp01_70560 [Kineosporia sp. NBRC 101677]